MVAPIAPFSVGGFIVFVIVVISLAAFYFWRSKKKEAIRQHYKKNAFIERPDGIFIGREYRIEGPVIGLFSDVGSIEEAIQKTARNSKYKILNYDTATGTVEAVATQTDTPEPIFLGGDAAGREVVAIVRV